MSERTVEMQVSLVGEVRAADLNGRSFTLRLEDGTEIPCAFTADQETVITQALRDHGTTKLHIQGRAELKNGTVQRVVSLNELTPTNPSQGPAGEATARPIWEVFVEAAEDIPEEELHKLPADFAVEHDHYLYGTPKRGG